MASAIFASDKQITYLIHTPARGINDVISWA